MIAPETEKRSASIYHQFTINLSGISQECSIYRIMEKRHKAILIEEGSYVLRKASTTILHVILMCSENEDGALILFRTMQKPRRIRQDSSELLLDDEAKEKVEEYYWTEQRIPTK